MSKLNNDPYEFRSVKAIKKAILAKTPFIEEDNLVVLHHNSKIKCIYTIKDRIGLFVSEIECSVVYCFNQDEFDFIINDIYNKGAVPLCNKNVEYQRFIFKLDNKKVMISNLVATNTIIKLVDPIFNFNDFHKTAIYQIEDSRVFGNDAIDYISKMSISDFKSHIIPWTY